jgi:hypothetical protein
LSVKGLILIPKYFENKLTMDRYYRLFNLMKKNLNFDIVFTNYYNVNKIKADVVVVFRSPSKKAHNILKNFKNLSKDIKLISYEIDINSLSDDVIKEMNLLMDRADKILGPYNYLFNKTFGDYIYKYEFFPQFFIFENYKNFDVNTNPMMKCLLSGMIGNVYPLRLYIDKNKNSNVVKLQHPGYTKLPISDKTSIYDFGKQYAKTLNKYFCCVATSSIYDCVVSKYVEIPAAGSLLLANYTPDLDKLGFVDDKNYINITKENFFSKLDDILKNPEKYEQIRRNGRKLVLKNFSDLNRFKQFKNIIYELLKK